MLLPANGRSTDPTGTAYLPSAGIFQCFRYGLSPFPVMTSAFSRPNKPDAPSALVCSRTFTLYVLYEVLTSMYQYNVVQLYQVRY